LKRSLPTEFGFERGGSGRKKEKKVKKEEILEGERPREVQEKLVEVSFAVSPGKIKPDIGIFFIRCVRRQ